VDCSVDTVRLRNEIHVDKDFMGTSQRFANDERSGGYEVEIENLVRTARYSIAYKLNKQTQSVNRKEMSGLSQYKV